MPARPIAALVLCALACASSSSPRPPEGLPRAGPGVLYGIGAQLAGAIAKYELNEAEAREVARGLVDAAAGRSYAAPLSPETAALFTTFDEQRLKELARREELAGAPVLEAAAREAGAVKTGSGMVLRVIQKGAGRSPTTFDFVEITFHGTLRDGTVFETNRGQPPSRLRLGETLRCWQEALARVSAGARVHVVCPPALGHGWVGLPGFTKGGAVLTYELELLSVEPMPELPQ